MRRRSALLGTFVLPLLLFGCSDAFLSKLRVSVADYELVGSQRVDPDHTDFTYRARCVNDGPPADAVVAVLQSHVPTTTVVEGTLRCGPVDVGSRAPSLDTFTIRQEGNAPVDPSALVWIVATVGKLESLETDDGPTRIQRRYRVSVTNPNVEATSARVFLASTRNTVVVTDDRADLILKTGVTIASSDLVEVVYERGAPFDAAALSLTLQLGAGSMEAVALVETLDGVGHPLAGVQIEESGPRGARTLSGDAESGVATLGQGGGELLWKFSKPGHLPVWRKQTVSAGKVALVPSPRLAERVSTGTPLSPLNDVLVSDGSGRLHLAFAAGAFPDGGEARLTPIDGQSLPAFLPAGWSPLAAFWLELPSNPTVPGTGELDLDDRITASDRAALVRFDPDTVQWQVVETLQGDGSAHVAATIPEAGAYAVVVADAGAGAPSDPVASLPLSAGTATLPDPATLQAEGDVTPAVSPASAIAQEVTGLADVRLTSTSPIPSGFVLEAVIADSYTMSDARTLALPGYGSFLVAYRRPGTGDEHQASLRFPLRPRLLFASDVLTEASVRAQVRAVSDFSGGVLSAGGGTLSTAGVELLAAAGDLEGTRPARLDALDASGFTALVPATTQAALAFELAVDGVSDGRSLRASFAPQAPNAFFVLARSISVDDEEGLEPVERFSSNAQGELTSTEPAAGERLPGIARSGAYVLLRVPAPLGLVTGIARDASGTPGDRFAVRIDGEPWLTRSRSAVPFRLVATVGNVTGVATDSASGDQGRATGALDAASSTLALDLTVRPSGPRVVTTDPANGATAVDPVRAIRVRFSEPLGAGSFGPDGLVLRDESGARIQGTLSLDLARIEASLLPTNPLAEGKPFTLSVDPALRDASGLALEGDRSFAFDTRFPVARGQGAQLVIYEPGAETAACNNVPGIDRSSKGVVCAIGSQGTADPNVPVVLVNDTTGATATVRSRPDGSFDGFIDAGVDELVSATFVNANQTRVTLQVTRQLFDDGSVGLYSAGGTIDAQNSAGTVSVTVEPGAIEGRTRLKLSSIAPADTDRLLGGTPPTDGQLVGEGALLTASGDPLRIAPDVSFKVDEAALAAQGFDPSKPKEATFALVTPRQVDGVVAYQVVDKMEYENGRLATHSPPFPGPNPNPAPVTPPDECNAGPTGLEDLEQSFDETMGDLEAFLFATDPLAFIVEKIAFWPLQMALRARPIVFTGKVEELLPGEVQCNAPLPVRRLPGAFVTVRPGSVNMFANGRGRLDPGQMFSVADSSGVYSIMLPRPAEDEAYALTAQHPRHPGLRIIEPANDVIEPNIFTLLTDPADFGAPTVETDLLFPAPLGNTREAPAQLSVSHVPLLPAPNTTAQVKAFGQHGLGPPVVTLVCKDAKPLGSGVTGSCSDVTILGPTDSNVGTTGIRRVFDVKTPKALRVILHAKAQVPFANATEFDYVVEFGGEAPPPQGGPPPSDPGDRVRPQVVLAWPPDGAIGITPGETIEIDFSEPLDKASVQTNGVITLSGPGLAAGTTPTLELSPDQSHLSVTLPPLAPNQEYTLSLSSAITDLVGNHLDRDPDTTDTESVTISFRTAEEVRGSLGAEFGAGAVLQGIYSYSIERKGTTDGALVVHDLSNPAHPTVASTFNLPAYPRDLALIPQYSLVHRLDEPAAERTLVAVVGGAVGGSTSTQGEFTGGGQFLILVDVTNPHSPQRFASTLLTLGPDIAVPRVVWSPPLLAYIEAGGDLQSIGVLDLQTFVIGSNATPAQFQSFTQTGSPGNDANGDGDYTDPGDTLPLPCRCLGEISGKLFGFALGRTTQTILDLAVDGLSAYVGAVVSQGRLRDLQGLPTGAQIAPLYRTFAKGSGGLPVPLADFSFPADSQPKRLKVFLGLPLLVNGNPTPTDVAIVSLHQAGASKLVLLDITDPLGVHALNEIPIPASQGLVQSIELRDDGLLIVATSNDLLLLDPRFLMTPAPATGDHPAIIGSIKDAGSGQRTVSALSAGLAVVSLGAKSQVVQTAPRLRIVSVPGVAPFDPASLAGDAAKRALVLEKMQNAPAAFPSRVAAEPDQGIPSDLDPPSPDTHYYVMLDAPGSAGANVPIALESLDLGGKPLRNLGMLYAPVRAMGPSIETQIGGAKRGQCDAQSTPLSAQRLSGDSGSPDYNRYLAGPFVLVMEELEKEKLDELRAAPLHRTVLWSGSGVRATIDPSIPNTSPLAPFASTVDVGGKRLEPGPGAVAFAFQGDYILGPNPEPIIGGTDVPSSFGTIGAHNGEVRIEDVDLRLPGRRLEIEWSRMFSAQNLYDGPYGRGWDFFYNQRLQELSPKRFGFGRLPLVLRETVDESEVAHGSDVIFQDGDGHTVLFTNKGDSAPPGVANDPLVAQLGWTNLIQSYYVPPRGVFDLLFKFKDGHFARLTPSGEQYWYLPDGRLTKIYDAFDRNLVTLVYNNASQLIQLRDELDRVLEIGWYRLANDPALRAIDVVTSNPSHAGKIAKLSDYSGRVVEYTYDEFGRLDKRRGPEVTVAALGGFKGIDETTYLWNDCSDSQKSGAMLRGVAEPGAGGTPIASASQYQPSGGRDRAREAKIPGAAITLTHSTPNEASKMSGATANFATPGNLSFQYRFNAFGQAEEVSLGSGAGKRTYGYHYNDDGLITRIDYPEGNATEYVYPPAGAPIRSRANVEQEVRHPAGGGSDPTYTQDSPHDPRFNLPAGPMKDFAGNASTVVLENLGRAVDQIQYANGDVEKFFRNEFGQVEHYTSADRVETFTSFDALTGFPATEHQGNLPPAVYTYGGKPGKRGLPDSVTDPNGVLTTQEWNERDQLVSETRLTFRQEYGYDINGRPTAQGSTAEAGKQLVERRHFDDSGFMDLVTVEKVEVDGALRDLPIRMFPDDAKRLHRIEYPDGAVKEIFYNGTGEIDHIKLGEHTESYTYDRNGALLTHTDDGATESHVLDGHRRVQQTNHPLVGVSHFTWDGNDNILSTRLEDPDFGTLDKREFAFDERNRQRLTKTFRDDGSTADSVIVFDAGQRKTTRTEANGAVLEDGWDNAGRTTTSVEPNRSETLHYDANGNTTQIDSLEDQRTYTSFMTYDDLDHPTKEEDLVGLLGTSTPRPDGAITQTFDALFRPTVRLLSILGEPLQVTKPNGVFDTRTYDENRRMKRIADAAGNASVNSFDTTQRLQESAGPGGISVDFQSFNAQNLPELAMLSGVASVEQELDLRGRPTKKTYSPFAGFPSRQETFVYDAADRPRVVTDPGGSIEHRYDMLATLVEDKQTRSGQTLAVKQKPDAVGFLKELAYPTVTLTHVRDTGGRLQSMTSTIGAPIVSNTAYVGTGLISSRSFGNGTVQLTADFDLRKRPIVRRFTNGQGETLLDLRYQFDAVDDLVARQRIDRGGRGDFYTYDAGARLTRSDLGVRPTIATEIPRSVTGFAQPQSVPGSWSPGLYARTTGFDDKDVLVNVSEINPDLVPAPPFAQAVGPFDAALHIGSIDNKTRTRDPLGNTTSGQLWVRDPGALVAKPVDAALRHDAMSMLRRVERADGVVVENEFDALGMRVSRTVTCPPGKADCQASKTRYLYHKGLLLEEYDDSGSAPVLRARYFYGDDMELLGTEIRQPGGGFARFYYLTDVEGSVLGVATEQGQLVERVIYDAFGEPRIELADHAPPRVRRIVQGPGGTLLVELSERVLPPLQAAGSTGVQSNFASLVDALIVRRNGATAPFGIEYAEREPGAALGTTLRVTLSNAVGATFDLQFQPGGIVDESRNPLAAVTIPVTPSATTGTVLFANANDTPTEPSVVARSSLAQPFLFHGEYFDYDTGLVYLRARFYQPSTGLFLERDPDLYSDSVNAYAGLGNNPVEFKDPTGRGVLSAVGKVAKAGGRAALAGARAVGRGALRAGKAVLHGSANIGRSIGRRYMSFVNRLEARLDRIAAPFERMAGSLEKKGVRQVEAAPARPDIAEEITQIRPMPSANVRASARPAGSARAAESPAGSATGALTPPAPLTEAEKARIIARNAARNAAGAEDSFRLARHNLLAEAAPDMRGVNRQTEALLRNGPTENCVACQNAFAMRRVGEHPTVTAGDLDGPERSFNNAFNPRDEQWARNLTPAEIVERVRAAGPGTAFHVRGLRAPGQIGHRFGVVNHNGTVLFIDAQSRTIADLSRRQGYLSFWLLRYQ